MRATEFPSLDRSTFVDPPFAVAPDIVLDIPVPLSVNETRKENKAARGKIAKWKANADMTLIASGQFRKAWRTPLTDRFEITIILNEEMCGLDADNVAKNAIDYVRRIELVKNDSPKYMRRVVIEWGDAPEGCRLILRSYA